MIMAFCVSAIPPPDDQGETGVRIIKETGVYTITAIFSVFAYIWLLIILMIILILSLLVKTS